MTLPDPTDTINWQPIVYQPAGWPLLLPQASYCGGLNSFQAVQPYQLLINSP